MKYCSSQRGRRKHYPQKKGVFLTNYHFSDINLNYTIHVLCRLLKRKILAKGECTDEKALEVKQNVKESFSVRKNFGISENNPLVGAFLLKFIVTYMYLHFPFSSVFRSFICFLLTPIISCNYAGSILVTLMSKDTLEKRILFVSLRVYLTAFGVGLKIQFRSHLSTLHLLLGIFE